MSEPKYKLNRRDHARWSNLVARECVNFVDASGKLHSDKHFPPLTAKEKLELEQLSRKRSRKIAAHPKVKAEHQYWRKSMRRVATLLAKVERMIPELKNKS